LALRGYEVENGALPRALEELVPGWLSESELSYAARLPLEYEPDARWLGWTRPSPYAEPTPTGLHVETPEEAKENDPEIARRRGLVR
ncbi:MAG: hypothetical protein KDC38_03910, partial [Planctomycetes bacterium]|nr:hypothetical protein [Planctomycetota bacterium]